MELPQRLDTEPEPAYALFCTWLREVGPDETRKSAPIARRLGVTPAKLATYKSRYRWIDRRTESGWDAQAIDRRPDEPVSETETETRALVGEVIDRAARRSEAAEAGTAWRDDIAQAARAIAATGPLAARAVSSYYKTIAESGEAPAELRDAAALAFRHFFPPDLAREVMVADSEDAQVQRRARTLGLTHPQRARENLANLGERILAAAAIDDPRPSSAQ